jgi:hypothetical protein
VHLHVVAGVLAGHDPFLSVAFTLFREGLPVSSPTRNGSTGLRV